MATNINAHHALCLPRLPIGDQNCIDDGTRELDRTTSEHLQLVTTWYF